MLKKIKLPDNELQEAAARFGARRAAALAAAADEDLC
jgi:hypothetical protein